MNNKVFSNILRLIILVALQVLIFNNVNFSGYINPYIYVIFILMLPFEIPRWLLLVSAFFAGLMIDVFSNTMGMHAAASVFMAFCRPGIIRALSAGKENDSDFRPNVNDMGLYRFILYALILVSIHHLTYFYIETFRLGEFFRTFFRAVLSILFTTLIVVLSQYAFSKGKVK